MLDAMGEVRRVIGSGHRGHAEGSLAEARLDDPQGLAWADDGALWICDARAHAVVRADLVQDRVTRIAGTGSMGHAPITGVTPALGTSLRSPWDLVIDGERVYVSLAGSHQLAVLVPDKFGGYTIDLLAGNGREALVDGTPRASCYAQPSGLAYAESALYVADSETSAIRVLDLKSGVTETLVGAGLFDFGNADGPLRTARLQHPLGVAVAKDGSLVVADTYNDRLRRINCTEGVVTTFFLGEGEQALREPGGLSPWPEGGWLVADTGNHRLVRIAASGRWEGELVVRGAPSPPELTGEPQSPLSLDASPATRWFDLALVGTPLAPGTAVLRLRLVMPSGWKLDFGAPLRIAIEVSRRSDLVTVPNLLDLRGQGTSEMSLEIPLTIAALPVAEVRSELLVRVDALLCGGTAGTEVCAPSQAWVRIPLVLASDGAAALNVDLPLVPPPRPTLA